MTKEAIEAAALSIRSLTMDAVQAANSGHPGLPMGMAELGALLYGEIMKHNPDKPDWINRDRFILSAGHGSMLLYSLFFLSGYDMTVKDIKNFRQVGFKTPGHPEYGHTPGVETTTGPLGQGIGNAVGMAVAEAMLAEKFNTAEHTIIDNYIYVLTGDGDMMEGISGEASSLAGHLGLGKLIVFYDSNKITIEGSTDLAFTEDVLKRYEAYGWQTMSGDAYDIDGIRDMVKKAKAENGKPSFILLKSIIGKGSPNKAGTHGVHGAALGEDEVKASKKHLGIPEDEEFYVAPEAASFFAEYKKTLTGGYLEWEKLFSSWAEKNPALKKEWDLFFAKNTDYGKLVDFPSFKKGDKIATRKASGKIVVEIAKALPNFVGGSADLAPSNNTAMPEHGDFSRSERGGRTLHFGVREHAMGALTNGIVLYGGLRPFCATFLVFSDYLRPSARLAALMNLPVIYVFTHDSIFVGEDGPTHQPIEHVAALRVIPNMVVLRPGDAEETAVAWQMALERNDGPSALCLTRQGLEVYQKDQPQWQESARKGAYVVKDCDGTPEVLLLATGSEVNLALKAAAASSRKVRVVSLLSVELFLKQDEGFRSQIVPPGIRTVVAEVGVSYGLAGFAACRSDVFALDSFGASGPGEKVAEYFGFTAERLTELLDS